MNKQDLIDAMAAKSGLTKADAGRALDAFMETVSDGLATGDTISLIGFGTFSVATRAARTGRNPSTGAKLEIPEGKTPKFSAGSKLKAAVSK